jgi:hypothetical protein
MVLKSKIDTRSSDFKLFGDKCCDLIMLPEPGAQKAAAGPDHVSGRVPKIKHLDAIK